ncbi:MAG TPA: SIS domain-containing protein [Solirubrobacter sp.]|nr:SIS domain-containing protein [Solirubrobacter sp.]
MRSFTEGVRLQASNLQAGLPGIRAALAATDLHPARAGTLILTGIGASWHALAPAVHALQAAGRRAYALHPSVLTGGGVSRLGDAFVLVSQSGKSTEVLDVLERLDGKPTIAISARGDSPLARAADAWLPLGPEADTAVSTLGYTTTLLTLGLLADALLERAGDWDELPERVDATLSRLAPPVRERADEFALIRTLDAAGAGPAAGTAGEAALLAREALLLPAASYETRQYLHGPVESVAGGFGAILFGAERELRLARELAGYGATVATVGPGGDLPVVPDPILQILPVQLLVAAVAERRGLNVDALAREQDDTKVAA